MEPGLNPGVRHTPDAAAKLLDVAALGGPELLNLLELAMVTARLDDGPELPGLNEVFIGHTSYQCFVRKS